MSVPWYQYLYDTGAYYGNPWSGIIILLGW